jgi:glutathione S-transferase
VQVGGALAELDRLCAAAGERPWLLGDTMTQADITIACYTTYLRDAVPLDLSAYPSLQERVQRCEALPVFQQFYVPFYTPVPNPAGTNQAQPA